MKDEDHRLADASELRRQAEDIARGKPPLSQEDRAVLSPAEMSQALEELRVHQIELELQNEELRCRQVELDALRERYFDLYDLAPIGYLVVSQQGLILEANLTAATLLGVARSDLVQQPLFSFILRKDEPSYYRHRKLLLETGTPQVWEMRMLKQRAAVFWVQVQATVTQDAGGEPVCRMAISDITERKTAEQFRLVADSAYDWEYWLLPDGSLPYVSPSCVEITGYRAEEFQQDPRLLIHIVHPDDRHRVARQAALAAGGDCQKMDFRIFTRGGEERWLAYACRPVWDYDGKPLGCRVSNRDITDRKRVEAALADLAARLALAVRVGSIGVWDQNVASNSLLWDDQMFQIYGITPGNFGSAHEAWQAGNRAARLALAVRAGGIGIWEWDIVANRLSWDHQMFQIYGITPDQFGSAYEAWRARLHPEDLQRGDEEAQLALRNEREYDTEFRVIRPDSAIRNIRALALVQRNAIGQPMHMIGINWDVTENKQAEEALRKSEDRFRAIANYTYDWENWIGTDGKLIWVNPAVLPFTGYSVDECLAMADFPLALIAESDHEKFRQLLAAAAQGSSGNNREFRIRCKDGSAKEATISWQPIYDSKGVNLGHRSSIRDVTASEFCP